MSPLITGTCLVHSCSVRYDNAPPPRRGAQPASRSAQARTPQPGSGTSQVAAAPAHLLRCTLQASFTFFFMYMFVLRVKSPERSPVRRAAPCTVHTCARAEHGNRAILDHSGFYFNISLHADSDCAARSAITRLERRGQRAGDRVECAFPRRREHLPNRAWRRISARVEAAGVSDNGIPRRHRHRRELMVAERRHLALAVVCPR